MNALIQIHPAALAAAVLVGVPMLAQDLAGQSVLFNTYDLVGGQRVQQLAAIRPDGTGETQWKVNLPEAGYPTLSRDGELLALISVNPLTPFSLSRNVFVLRLPTAEISAVTRYADRANSGSGPGGSATVSACFLPWYKAFSPDKTRMAISTLEFTGVTWSAPDTDSPPPNPNNLYSGSKGTPVLQVYGLDGTPGPLVATGSSGGNTVHAGDGVDWAPNQDLLVFPKDTQLRVSDPYGQVFMMPITPLFLMPPINDAVGSGKATQLTHPQAAVTVSWSGYVSSWETDFQPAFSPDGKQIAYVRSRNTMNGAYVPPTSHSLRLVNIDGSNDRAFISFDPGAYISHVTWSPDGRKLAYASGREAVSSLGLPLLMADPTTCTIWVSNLDGTERQMLRGPAANWPAWSPAPAINPAPAPRLGVRLSKEDGFPAIVIEWPLEAGQLLLRSTRALGPQAVWEAEPTQPTAALGKARVTIIPETGGRFYRAVQR